MATPSESGPTNGGVEGGTTARHPEQERTYRASAGNSSWLPEVIERSQYLKGALATPLGANDLPYWEELAEWQYEQPPLEDFMLKILGQARDWNDIDQSEGGKWKRASRHDSKYKIDGKDVKVESLKKDEGSETWFMRKSSHAQPDVKFEHLEHLLRVDHGPKEADAMPAVIYCNTVLKYDLTRKEYETSMRRLLEEGWHHPTIDVIEMFHNISPIPGMLNRRVFTQLVVTAVFINPSALDDARSTEFVVVQLPINYEKFPKEFWEDRTSVKSGKFMPKEKEVAGEHYGGKLVRATYASVEKVVQQSEGGGVVNVWTMSTSSNAKGALPEFVQKPSIPGQINHDVKLILAQIKKMIDGNAFPDSVNENVERAGIPRQQLGRTQQDQRIASPTGGCEKNTRNE
ncbi:hypothetical protein BDV96DRAFT_602389 [Lophiotrema nucula]|uniref:DUF3074 domain-containing protein n=1 Tax=Lophiotrema nucula TaxID=690887 RepID=A0A6A5YZA9_9PLEO|nr:hypothetical protein BDV96DRAFT_602389 [Lophiotrema nucula]